MLEDQNLQQGQMTIFCGNKSVIDTSKNPVKYSPAKHINHEFSAFTKIESKLAKKTQLNLTIIDCN